MKPFQIILVVESNEKSRSDYIYIKSIINELYKDEIENDVKISPVFMGGKGNYKKTTVTGRINKFINLYKPLGKSHIVYCFDTDNYDTVPDDCAVFCEERQYCLDNEYKFVWFCHDIEEVFIGKSVAKHEKTKTALSYSRKQGIKKINLQCLKFKDIIKGKSNLLVILDEVFKEELEE